MKTVPPPQPPGVKSDDSTIPAADLQEYLKRQRQKAKPATVLLEIDLGNASASRQRKRKKNAETTRRRQGRTFGRFAPMANTLCRGAEPEPMSYPPTRETFTNALQHSLRAKSELSGRQELGLERRWKRGGMSFSKVARFAPPANSPGQASRSPTSLDRYYSVDAGDKASIFSTMQNSLQGTSMLFDSVERFKSGLVSGLRVWRCGTQRLLDIGSFNDRSLNKDDQTVFQGPSGSTGTALGPGSYGGPGMEIGMIGSRAGTAGADLDRPSSVFASQVERGGGTFTGENTHGDVPTSIAAPN